MGKSYDGITPELSSWIGRQRMFFVATAPLAGDGLINCSPKGMDTFRILGPRDVAYMDLTGSGIETIAHSRENGRIVFMFCAFEGPPKIVRLHGTSEVLLADSPEFQAVASLIPTYLAQRAIIRARLTRISDSCGYGVPRYEYAGDRDMLVRWSASKGPEGLRRYRREKNARSLDDLPGLTVASD
jgi:Pyridoxamine 5'-phosphate oxidase